MKKSDRYEITTNDYGMFITDRKTQDIYTNTNIDDFKKLRVLLNYQDQKIDNLNIPTLPENIVNTINGQTGDVVLPDTGTKVEDVYLDNLITVIDNLVEKTSNYEQKVKLEYAL